MGRKTGGEYGDIQSLRVREGGREGGREGMHKSAIEILITSPCSSPQNNEANLRKNYSQRSQILVEDKQDRVKSDNNFVTGLRQQICACTHNNKHYRVIILYDTC